MTDPGTVQPARGFDRLNVRLQVDGVTVDVAAIGRGGTLEPIVFLHGFGSTKEDDADSRTHRCPACLRFARRVFAWPRFRTAGTFRCTRTPS